MKRTRQCSACGGTEIYTTEVSAGGGYAPDLLPGAHPWWRSGKLEIYVCTTCGLLQHYVPDGDLDEVRESKKFRRLS